MTSYIIDANVAAKWFLPAAGELLIEEALDLRNGFAEGRIRLFVPDLFWLEIGNTVWKAVRAGPTWPLIFRFVGWARSRDTNARSRRITDGSSSKSRV